MRDSQLLILIIFQFGLQSFKVAAVDGDTELNKPIWYELGFYENQDCEPNKHILF